jgi:hypothetical protein
MTTVKTKLLDLKNNKYNLDILKENIYAINLLEILKTQIIDEEFAVNYILNILFQFLPEEETITLMDVIKYQPQLNRDLLHKLIIIGPPPISTLPPFFDNLN